MRPDLARALAERAHAFVVSGAMDSERTNPCACGGPEVEHAGTAHRGGHPGTGCRRYRPDTAYQLAARAVDNADTHPLDDVDAYLTGLYPRPTPAPGGHGVGPSDYLGCRKAIQLREAPPPGMVRNDVDMFAARAGSGWHELTRLAREKQYPWREYEHEVAIPGLDRVGRLDEYDGVLARVKDLKFPGEHTWNDLADGPDPAHRGQGHIYGLGMRAQGRPVDTVEIEYMHRMEGEVERFPEPYDEGTAEEALDWLSGVNFALDVGAEMERDRGGPSSDVICERFCPVRDHCWNVAAAKAAGRSPESYTILGAEPEQRHAVWAAERALSFKRDRAEAKTEYTRAHSLLVGLHNGRYGDVLVTNKSRKMPEHEKWAKAVKAALDDGATAEQLQKIPLTYRWDHWVEVKPVRAADLDAEEAAARAAEAADAEVIDLQKAGAA
ncbi:hypothetical protein [Actinomadura violacea]|uniref:Uncharacterized protein n=1 Tax=Actinomadura violacea TaxID=2819934 RepID=A0ABS3RY12_9ACTN|nr:hypothetical protein [Actinomadura violacea]MBO2461654.1 hypothetical protein [Actinomadura violacea]